MEEIAGTGIGLKLQETNENSIIFGRKQQTEKKPINEDDFLLCNRLKTTLLRLNKPHPPPSLEWF